MLIALVIVGIGFLIILFALGRDPIPWTSHLRRVKAGTARKAEWIAPEPVIEHVRNDYLEAVNWLQSTAYDRDTRLASHYLIGRFLARFETISQYSKVVKQGSFQGVFIARHHVQVRQFSEDGGRCLVVDFQTERRMKSLYMHRPNWFLAQDLGDGVVVFQMCYDVVAKRWKIEAFIQELPPGWADKADIGYVHYYSELPTSIGRDY